LNKDPSYKNPSNNDPSKKNPSNKDPSNKDPHYKDPHYKDTHYKDPYNKIHLKQMQQRRFLLTMIYLKKILLFLISNQNEFRNSDPFNKDPP
jgi:hypothetical protein